MTKTKTMTHKYEVRFHGRENYAIGIFSDYKLIIEAPDKKTAILKVYETHEHLNELTIEEIN